MPFILIGIFSLTFNYKDKNHWYNKFIETVSKNSLGIYLYHMFFVNITYMVFPKTTIMGIVGFFISLFASLGINMMIYRIHTLRILLYPKNINEIKTIFFK